VAYRFAQLQTSSPEREGAMRIGPKMRIDSLAEKQYTPNGLLRERAAFPRFCMEQFRAAEDLIRLSTGKERFNERE
jgi:hypothetical protein